MQLNIPIPLTKNDLGNKRHMHLTGALLAGLKRRVHGDMLHMLFDVYGFLVLQNFAVASLHEGCGISIKRVNQTLFGVVYSAGEQDVVVVSDSENVAAFANRKGYDVVPNIIQRFAIFFGGIYVFKLVCFDPIQMIRIAQIGVLAEPNSAVTVDTRFFIKNLFDYPYIMVANLRKFSGLTEHLQPDCIAFFEWRHYSRRVVAVDKPAHAAQALVTPLRIHSYRAFLVAVELFPKKRRQCVRKNHVPPSLTNV
jgi:hypothetical protein